MAARLSDREYDALLEQYKVFVEGTDRVTQRRHTANTFFLAIHTLLVGTIGTLLGIEGGFVFHMAVSVAAAGLVLCIVWYRLLASYKSLNDAKFAVVLEMEKRLPVAPFSQEWKLLEKGQNPKKHKIFTHLERWVPGVFALLYLAVAVLHALAL